MNLPTLQEAFTLGISYKTTVMLAAFVLFLSVTTSSSKANEILEDIGYIVGGNPTTIENVPWQAALTTYSGELFCGGAIVSELIIITAAHCLHDESRPSKVRTGSTRLNEGGVLTDVLRTVQHELYSSPTSPFGYDYDIGIVVLSEPLQFGPGTKAISLAKQDDRIVEGELLQVTGWGYLTEGGQSPDVLHEVYVPVYKQKACKAILFLVLVTERQFCGGYIVGGKDSCQGDSGGPAVINGTLVGIISWGLGCGNPLLPGVYTKIAAFRNWLDTNALL